MLLNVAVKEGDTVSKGQVLAVIDPRPFKAASDKAQAQLVQDQAQLDNAKLDQNRYGALAKRDFASRQQLDTQTATVNRLQGVVAADRASIEEAQINLDYAVIKSPLDGKVGLRRVDPGNVVQANGAGPGILSVVQEQPISVIFSLPETDLPTVRDAMRKGQLAALADAPNNDRVLDRGALSTTDNAVDPNSGTIQMRADFPNPDGLLYSGPVRQPAAAGRDRERRRHPAYGGPARAGRLVRVRHLPERTIKRQDVTVAYDDGRQAVIQSGLQAGTLVVTAGQSRIGDGIKVSFKESGEDEAQRQSAQQGAQSAAK